MCNHSKQASGFTLLELIVAISIAGILMALAIPSFSDMMRNNRLTTYANELVTSLNLARSEAIKRGVTVTVAKTSATTASYWSESGWNLFIDTDRDNNFDLPSSPPNPITDDILIRTYAALPTNYILMANNFKNYITYKADGTSNTNGSFAVCDNSDGSNIAKPYASRLIIINKMGRIQMGKDTNNDGIPEQNDTAHTKLTDCTSP
ncbi:MAG: GspH/FimT family pseudopilin [Methylococcales bacterium]